MKLFATLALVLAASFASAEPLPDFATLIRKDYIKPLALDLGGILGSASQHSGRTLGFPGFWVGAIGAIQFKPDVNDRVLRDSNVKTFGLPMLEAGVGLPFNIDVIVHGITASGWKIYGGGIRYGVYQTGLIDTFLPNVSLSAFGDRINQDFFNLTHAGFNATATWNLPIIKPFILAGLDVTKLKVTSATTPGVAGLSDTATGSRFSLGADLTPFPFISLRGAYTLRHGMPGADMSLGVKF